MKLFAQTASDARDMFLAFDSGSAKGAAEIRRSFNKLQKQHDTWSQTNWWLLPASQLDLEARAKFRSCESLSWNAGYSSQCSGLSNHSLPRNPNDARGGRKRKRAASLSSLGGPEGAHVLSAGFTLPARELRFLTNSAGTLWGSRPYPCVRKRGR